MCECDCVCVAESVLAGEVLRSVTFAPKKLPYWCDNDMLRG